MKMMIKFALGLLVLSVTLTLIQEGHAQDITVTGEGVSFTVRGHGKHFCEARASSSKIPYLGYGADKETARKNALSLASQKTGRKSKIKKCHVRKDIEELSVKEYGSFNAKAYLNPEGVVTCTAGTKGHYFGTRSKTKEHASALARAACFDSDPMEQECAHVECSSKTEKNMGDTLSLWWYVFTL